jgi:hypothetical protein
MEEMASTCDYGAMRPKKDGIWSLIQMRLLVEGRDEPVDLLKEHHASLSTRCALGQLAQRSSAQFYYARSLLGSPPRMSR